MTFLKSIAVVFVLTGMVPFAASACGPSPQKVVREIIIRAEPTAVWAVIKNFGGIYKWHPAVVGSTVEQVKDSAGGELTYRTVRLKDGGTIVEKQRETQGDEMKLSYVMMQGDIPVSNYSSWMTVNPGPGTGESTVTWVGRFSNKANAVETPAGQDNKAAVAAIEAIYDAGLNGMKQLMEARK